MTPSQAKALPIGADVVVYRDDKSKWRTKTRSKPWSVGGGRWLILLEGKAGGYDLARVERAPAGDAT